MDWLVCRVSACAKASAPQPPRLVGAFALTVPSAALAEWQLLASKIRNLTVSLRKVESG